MVNEEHLQILEQGVEVWNRWREEKTMVVPNLSGANLAGWILSTYDFHGALLNNVDLRGAVLARANFGGASLGGAQLRGADITRAYLLEANLDDSCLDEAKLFQANLRRSRLLRVSAKRTDFGEADLSRARLTGANLNGASLNESYLRWADLRLSNLSETDLSMANLSQVYFDRTDLSLATMGRTNLGDVDLRDVIGLDTIVHRMPSHIDVRSIYRSDGKLPERFLRGVGVPEPFIEYADSFIKAAIEYYSVFISYSNRDREFAERVYNDLQSSGVRCWYAPEDLKTGEKYRKGIDETIRLHDKLLLVLSEHSIASQWVEKEVETAFESEREGDSLILFPIRLDDTVFEVTAGWAADIRRTRHIGDFINWKDDDEYQKNFQRLLADLKAS